MNEKFFFSYVQPSILKYFASAVFNPCSPGKIGKKKTILEIIFFYLFIKNNSATILLLKVLHLLVSYPPSYTWLKGKPQISRKERFIPSQVLTVWSTWWLSILVFSVNVHQYIYIYIYIYSCSIYTITI